LPVINDPETVNAWVMAGGKVWEVSDATQPQSSPSSASDADL
jgi:hypothetical protein